MDARRVCLPIIILMLLHPLMAQQSAPHAFTINCAGCHGEQARGTSKGPALAGSQFVAAQTIEQLKLFLERGKIVAGMPSFADISASDMAAVVGYLHSVNLNTVINPAQSVEAVQKFSSLAPGPGDWASYNGSDSANRYSPFTSINRSNVARLKVKWIFPVDYFGLETTPLEVGGVLYATGPNQVFAIDAQTGQQLWKYSRPASAGMTGDAKLGTNRGVAILQNKVFYMTDNAHLLALERSTGKLLWDISIAPNPAGQHYGGTMAPLIVDGMVIVGVSGADEGIRGFIAAFNPDNGELKWRCWTVPLAGEPGIETWQGKEPLTGGGSTWLTGSYDASTDTLYWAVGNPWPDGDDVGRPGDNLYTDSALALNAKTGEIKWHYQFTPHDIRDRDATEPNVLVDTQYKGKPSKLLLHADRNGFFYVFDRSNGTLLLAKQFLRRVDWASGIGADGRPVVVDPKGCPDDAANWDSTAYSPTTHLYYLMAIEQCGRTNADAQRYLRALNIETGDIVWEVPQPGPAPNKLWTGVLATAGGLVFYGQPNGGFAAVNQNDGKTVWRFPTNVGMKASPMTYMLHGKQYIVVAAGPNIICFAL